MFKKLAPIVVCAALGCAQMPSSTTDKTLDLERALETAERIAEVRAKLKGERSPGQPAALRPAPAGFKWGVSNSVPVLVPKDDPSFPHLE
jgi:hypothetical protein